MAESTKPPSKGKNHNKLYSKKVADKIIEDIVSGKYPPESKLPTEREMSKTFEVTRHVVREALKTVQAWNLISIQQGSGAKVNNYKTSCGLELMEYLLEQNDDVLNAEIFMELIEYHEILAVASVRLAAQHISKKELQQLEALVKKRGKSENEEERAGLTLEISRVILDASRNTCIQLTFNSIIRISSKFGPIVNLNFPSPFNYQDVFDQLVHFFRERDHEMAALLATRYFRKTIEYFKENKSDFFGLI